MRAYGKPRAVCANRNIPGTSRPCPCCERGRGRAFKKVARQEAKRLCEEDT